jgi:hypothetical protein
MDPFTILLSGVEEYLKANPVLKAELKGRLKNFVAYNKSRQDTLDVKGEADLPMIMVEPNGGPTSINLNSGRVYFDYQITVYVFTGEQNVLAVNPIMWAIFAAIVAGQENTLLTALRWRDKPFVDQVMVNAVQMGLPSDASTPGLVGWTAIATFVFRLYFGLPTILAFSAGE